MAIIFDKIVLKAQFLVKLNIPTRFKKKDPTVALDGEHLELIRAPSHFGEVPQSKTDWQERLKRWKSMQTQKGVIKSLTERKADIWDSGIMSIMALLQISIE
jgi:hypothetical protein